MSRFHEWKTPEFVPGHGRFAKPMYLHVCKNCGLDVYNDRPMNENSLGVECVRQGTPYDNCEAYQLREVLKVMES